MSLTLYVYRAAALSVVDGDTVDVDISLGFGLTQNLKRARLSGINAPELSTPEGQASADHLRQLLGALPATVSVQTFKDRQDNYGRILVRLVTPSGLDVNKQMIADGFAVPLGPLPALPNKES